MHKHHARSFEVFVTIYLSITIINHTQCLNYLLSIFVENALSITYNLFQNQKSTNSALYLENTTDNVANFCF
jgi:hypothetical protein